MQPNPNNKQIVELHPRLGGFLWTYIIFSLPGFVISILGIILMIIVVIGTAAGFAAAGSVTSDEEILSYKTLKTGGSNSVLVYNLSGPMISGGSDSTGVARSSNIYTDVVAEDFKEIKNDSSIKNVVFKMNTPGGEIFAAEVIGDLIKDLLENKNQKEGIFYFDQISASGGLWATYKNNNYVFASPYGETGSIGVRLALPNVSKLADNIGYKELVIKSSDNKDVGNIFRDPTTGEVKYFQDQVDESYDKFINIVATGRQLEKSKVKEIATGFTFNNPKAKSLGLVDEIGSLSQSWARAADKAGIANDYSVIEIQPESNFLQGLLATTNLPSLVGLSDSTIKKIEKTTSLETGKLYAIDEYKI